MRIIELSNYENDKICISNIHIKSMPVDHTITCLSYCIKIKRQGKFDVDRAQELNISVKYWNNLQKGETLELEDRIITPEMVLGEPRKGIKVCYCTDSRPVEGLEEFVKDSDLFICEGM